MNHFFIYFSLFTCFSLASLSIKAQEEDTPSYNPMAIIVDEYGTETDTISTTSESHEAPLHLVFRANGENIGSWVANYEWIVTKSNETEPILDRYLSDDETTLDINESGEYKVYCYAIFVNGNDSIKYDEEYWAERTTEQPFSFSVATSHLEFPNAFSPNGDGRNDTYGPKGHTESKTGAPKSIVEYHMSIYNRWGQRLFDTHNIEDYWDGTYNGRDVKEGVYYVVCTAKGADGIKYNIKKDVNLLRGILPKDGSSTSTDQ